jgi:hypothetical protein
MQEDEPPKKRPRPNDEWSGYWDGIGQQSQKLKRFSDSGTYFAFVSKVDEVESDEGATTWIVYFEMMTFEWAFDVLFLPYSGTPTLLPAIPDSAFHCTAVPTDVLTRTLHLKQSADLAEGMWFVLELEKGGSPDTQMVGGLYDPDIDRDDKAEDLGNWHIKGALGILAPRMDGPRLDLGPPDGGKEPTTFGALTDIVRQAIVLLWLQTIYDVIRKCFRPIAPQEPEYKRPKLDTPPKVIEPPFQFQEFPVHALRSVAPLGDIEAEDQPARLGVAPGDNYPSVGIMDIGIGGFNMVIDETGRIRCYFDMGYPLPFFTRTAPAYLQNPNRQYPPGQRTDRTRIPIVLSHWDWDHWRLSYLANLERNNYVVPDQPLGPSASNWSRTITRNAARSGGAQRVYRMRAGFGTRVLVDNLAVIVGCVPPRGSSPAFYMNNSGIALAALLYLPAGNRRYFYVMSGDANLNLLPMAIGRRTKGVNAVHHGSNNHNAATSAFNAANGNGAIIYSYGWNDVTGNYPYGFPSPAAILTYRAKNWTVQRSTAQWVNIRQVVNPRQRGNIRVGGGSPSLVNQQGNSYFTTFYGRIY